MNTVGKQGRLGESIRCVVSVSMLTEGWDANTVTHVLGVRAFGTQLLCEQVIGRALRRQSYDLNEEGLFNVEYADVLGIPFDFTAKPVVAPPQPPRETIQVKAVRPERDALEIRFPRVAGLPRRTARGAAHRRVQRRLRAGADARPGRALDHQKRGHHRRGRRPEPRAPRRHAPLHAALPPHPAPALHQVARPGRRAQAAPVRPAQAHHQAVARHLPGLQGRHLSRPSSCTRSWPTWPASASPPASPARFVGERPIKAVLDPYNPTGSTAHVNFNTSKTDRWETDRAPLPRQLGHPRQRLGGRVLPRRRGAPARAGLRQEPQPRPRSALPLRLRDAQVPPGLHRAGGRRPRRRRPAAPRSSRSRATAARTPRRRRPRWTPTGCPA